MRLTRGPWRLFLVLPALALTLAACSSGSTDQVATLTGASASASSSATMSPADREKLALQFAACVRQNGIPDFPDPTVDQNGNLQLFANGFGSLTTADREKMRTAFTACQQYAEGLRAGFSQEDQQQMQDQILAFAQCMRDNGYNMPDPTFGPRPTDGASSGGDGPFGGFNQNDPVFQQALNACRDKLPGIIGGGAPGAGFAGGASAPAPTPSS